MSRPTLEIANIFRDHGTAWRDANCGHVSLDQMKVMSAIERCRTAALGGHVARCENGACGHIHIAYNSCRVANADADVEAAAKSDEPKVLNLPCSVCGGRMMIIEAFAHGMEPKHRPAPEAIDSS